MLAVGQEGFAELPCPEQLEELAQGCGSHRVLQVSKGADESSVTCRCVAVRAIG